MKQFLRNIFCTFVHKTGWYALACSTRKNNQLSVLMYHRIVANGNKDKYAVVGGVTVSDFEQQVAYLAQHCNVLSMETYLSLRKEKKPLPDRAVIITFDDGYQDNYENAFPILKKYNMPATIFLATGHIDSDALFWWDRVAYALKHTKQAHLSIPGFGLSSSLSRPQALKKIIAKLKTLPEPKKKQIIQELITACDVSVPPQKNNFLTWDHIREMAHEGISFASHTVTHPIMTKISLQQALQEIAFSRQTIYDELGSVTNVFAYPNGDMRDRSDELDSMLKKQGIIGIFTTRYGVNIITPGLVSHQRIGIEPEDDVAMFKLKLEGIGAALVPLYQRLVM